MAEVRWHRAAAGVLHSLPETVADRVLQATRLLAQFPALGMRINDPQWPHMRRIVVRDWRIVYAYDSATDVVTVIGVIATGTGQTVQ